MNHLINVLKKVRENPNKYIGKKSIMRLELFIVGYVLSQRDETGEYSNELEKFQEFVQQKYNITYAVRYSEIIRLCSISDDLAFDKFYDLLDEFQKKYNF